MADTNWEDMISLNSRTEVAEVALGAPRDYLNQDIGEVRWDQQRIPLEQALASDTAPLPTTEHREGYQGRITSTIGLRACATIANCWNGWSQTRWRAVRCSTSAAPPAA